MAQIKKEDDSVLSCSDSWLFHWANQNEEVKTEDTKQNVLLPKSEYNENSSKDGKQEGTKSKQQRKNTLSKGKNNDIKSEKLKMSATRKITKNKEKSLIKQTTLFALKQKELDKAPVSDVISNLCEYRCPKCHKIHLTKHSISKHFKKTGHAQICTHGSIIKFMTKIVSHQCFVCSKKIMCEKNIIRSHLCNCHQIHSLKSYSDQFNLKLQTYRTEFETFNAQSNNNITNYIGNLCKFSCTKCEYSSQNWVSMARHLKDHGTALTPSLYLISDVILHNCQVCQENILCDYRLIRNHISKHKLTVMAYKECFPHNHGCINGYIKELKSNIEDIPAIQPKNKTVLKPDSLPENAVTKDIGNISFFKCTLCPKADMSFKNLLHHFKSVHKMKSVHFKADMVAEARYHRCHICDKIVLCDNSILIKHVQKHKITLSQYAKDYVLKNDGKVFSNYWEYCKSKTTFHGKLDNEETSEEDEPDNGLILPDMISSESEESDMEG